MADLKLDYSVLSIMALLSLWAATQFSQLTGQSETANISMVFFGMALFTILAFTASGRISFFQTIGINAEKTQLAILFLLGGAIGFFSTQQGKLFLAPTSTISASIDPTLSMVFVIGIAVFVEEYFFRGFLLATLRQYFATRGKSGLLYSALAILLSSLIFVAWHLVAYQGQTGEFTALFVFSLLLGGVTVLTNSLAPAIGAHFFLNLINSGV